MYKDTLKDSGVGADKSVEELQVEVELQRLNNHTLKEDQTNNEDQTDQDDGDDEDAGDQEIDQPPDLIDYQLVWDREPRTRTKPLRFRDESNMASYAFAATEEEDTHEPLTYQEAVACEDSSKKNKTWELVDHQARQKLVTCKWLFKIKEGIKRVQKPRYKARLVAHGFTQRACIYYNEVFSPVVRHTSIQVILALTACKDFELEQLDVKTAFLHGNLEEVIYMRQPPRQDDMLISCKSKAEIGSTKSLLKKEFDMKDLREAKKILGMEIVRDRTQDSKGVTIWLSLKDCPIRDCDVEMMSKVPYANAVGSLMYLMVCTRPDIAYEDVTGFVDSDYAKDLDKGRIITGYTFLVQGCVVSWKAMLQHVVALSTTEAEYMALTEAVKEAILLKGLLEELVMES
nr:retrotransposon protein, putative, Ty1-copia subclass [Tanacetum cinerariifolium]